MKKSFCPIRVKHDGETHVKRSPLSCNRNYDNEERHSPVHGQVKQYCFTCPWTGEAVLLHLD